MQSDIFLHDAEESQLQSTQVSSAGNGSASKSSLDRNRRISLQQFPTDQSKLVLPAGEARLSAAYGVWSWRKSQRTTVQIKRQTDPLSEKAASTDITIRLLYSLAATIEVDITPTGYVIAWAGVIKTVERLITVFHHLHFWYQKANESIRLLLERHEGRDHHTQRYSGT